MPTYEYKCPAGHVFEKFFSTMNDDRWQKCPNCGQRAERLISGGAALVFRGSGFYATDYKRGGEEKKESEKKERKKKESEKKERKKKESEKKEPQQGESKPSDSSKKHTDSGDK